MPQFAVVRAYLRTSKDILLVSARQENKGVPVMVDQDEDEPQFEQPQDPLAPLTAWVSVTGMIFIR